MGKILTIAGGDLSEVVPLLQGHDCVIDEANGIFVAKLPTREQGFRILCHPASKLVREVTLANGTVELAVKRG